MFVRNVQGSCQLKKAQPGGYLLTNWKKTREGCELT